MKSASKKNIRKNYFSVLVVLLFLQNFTAQTTSWKGITSSSWNNATNWTAGVPVATIDAIIGDANFTGAFQPTVNATAACKSLTIGNAAKVSAVNVTKNITVSGNILIGNNGTVTHATNNTTITVKGNWTNSGTYSATISTAQVTFSGTTQTLTGPGTFKKIMINSGSILTLAANIAVNTSLSISGTIDPGQTFSISGTGSLTVNSNGKLLVKAANFATNYSLSGSVTLSGTSNVNYASAVIDQTISNAFSYGYLRVSGGMTKYLSGNLPGLSNSTSSAGRVYIDAGTLDLLTFTANRSASGGAFIIGANAKLRIGGTNGFPSNYSSTTIASTSTVEYYGNNQTVLAVTYGNLTFSSTTGTVVKTMPGNSMTITGNFTSQGGTGTGVSFTAGNNITVNQNVSLDAASIFNGGSYTLTFKGNFTNNGTFTGNTSTVALSGVSAVVSGTGINNFNNLTFSGPGITAASTVLLSVAGNLSTSGSGTFTHASGGQINVSGTSKTITGVGLKLYNCTITGTITTTATLKKKK
ncbi:MAG: hypothetical protein IAF38_00180, partial [Bacteroidia bacterium]|nr:hypothetical protein [Bacteroidia bacterium]